MYSTLFIKVLFVVALLTHFQNTAIAQEDYTTVTQDLESWSKVGIRLKINKNWAFGLDQHLRLSKNSSAIDQVITDLYTKYKFDNSFYLGGAVRYIADSKNDSSFGNDFRFNLDAGYQHKIKRFNLNYRLRYQNKNEIGLSKLEGDDFDHVFRLKIGVEYNIKKWKFDPQFSAEIFNDLSESSDKLQKIRFTLGSNYSFKKVHKIGAFYRIEKEVTESYPKTTYIIGLNYKYTLKLKR